MVMTKDLQKIRDAYFLKARKDRKAIKDRMSDTFGYGLRHVNHKITGTYALTDRERDFLFEQLKLDNQTKQSDGVQEES